MVTTTAGLPLAHQPGEFWEYSVSTNVLGRIVEIVSGMDLDRFIAERAYRSAPDDRHRLLPECGASRPAGHS